LQQILHIFKDKTAFKYVDSCSVYFSFAKMTKTQTSKTNFATEQKVGFIEVNRETTTAFVETLL